MTQTELKNCTSWTLATLMAAKMTPKKARDINDHDNECVCENVVGDDDGEHFEKLVSGVFDFDNDDDDIVGYNRLTD